MDWARQPAYLVAAWCLLFALVSFYWALGGDIGVNTVGSGIRENENVELLLWLTGVAKLLGIGLALALIEPWGWRLPRWLLLIAGTGAGLALTAHGLEFLIGGTLMLTGVIEEQSSLGDSLPWYVGLWGPWWTIGGLLFLWATWRFWRPTSH